MGRDDGELFAEVARGNLGALGALFDRHHEAVRSVAIHAGVPRHEADDAVRSRRVAVKALHAYLEARDDGQER